MNADRPLQLYQKIQFLQDKIDFYYQSIKQTSQFQLKMKFIQFIDTSIEKICNLDNKKQYSSEVVHKKYEEYYNAQQNDREKRRIQIQKLQLNSRIKDLSEKEKQLEVESLKIELENSKILKEKMNREYSAREIELKTYILQLQKKMKSVQKQFQRVVKLNSGQARQIQVLKQERNKAEKRELQWRDKYQAEIGSLQTFGNKKNKYLFRHEQGLRIYRTVTNATTVIKGCERIVLCDLPIKFHVAKIVYGIKIGHILSNRQVNYFNEVSLYEKEQMLVQIIEGSLKIQYLKRKVIINLEKYTIINNQIIIMLFGKGDSIAIDQSG